MASFKSARIFRLSSFNPNHRQMILRSDPELVSDSGTRVEVYFGNVEYVAVRPLLRGVNIRLASMDERKMICERYGIEKNLDYAFIVDDGPPISFVISGNPSWKEAVRALDEPSLFDFSSASDVGVSSGTVE